MNVLFAAVFIACSARLLFVSPEEFLPALLSSASSAAALCMALLSSYCVFCGLSALWEDSGVTAAIAKFLKKPVRVLFRSDDPHAAECVCMNVSANLLGLGALATPYGVRAAALMGESESKYRDYSLAVLFTLNAASLQAIPTSVIALRTAAGSLAPSSVVCPILLSSLFFLLTALPVVIFVYKPKEKKKSDGNPCEEKTPRADEKERILPQARKNRNERRRERYERSFLPDPRFVSDYVRFCGSTERERIRIVHSRREKAPPLILSVFPYIAAVTMISSLFEKSGLPIFF